MRTTLLSTLLILFAGNFSLHAQDDVDPGHENHYFTPEPVETDQYKITFHDPHSQLEFVQVKLQIENKTNNYLKVNLGEFSFHIDEKEHNPKDKIFFIPPKDDASKRLKVSGGENFHVPELTFEMKGLYEVPVEGKKYDAEPFKLPASTNQAETGPFRCNLEDLVKETDVTEATFDCRYLGENGKVALIDHRKVSVKTEDGEEFANKYKRGLGRLINKNPLSIVRDGERFDVNMEFEIPAKVVDMQFATLYVQWNDLFLESTPKELEAPKVDFELDERKTEERN